MSEYTYCRNLYYINILRPSSFVCLVRIWLQMVIPEGRWIRFQSRGGLYGQTKEPLSGHLAYVFGIRPAAFRSLSQTATTLLVCFAKPGAVCQNQKSSKHSLIKPECGDVVCHFFWLVPDSRSSSSLRSSTPEAENAREMHGFRRRGKRGEALRSGSSGSESEKSEKKSKSKAPKAEKERSTKVESPHICSHI